MWNPGKAAGYYLALAKLPGGEGESKQKFSTPLEHRAGPAIIKSCAADAARQVEVPERFRSARLK
ncbi:hypothetical protein rosag_31320 [Roseisolibacter agri]|uniref:Uncharacterized protein n=1 Tax=Roseisolibacter agri TaxID=2014610 RepID=A0AA37Q5C1_9BACT|nr:hypothetical protein rosag_31320 [Roseisolibacter agri]